MFGRYATGPQRADTVAAGLPAGAWQRLSAGDGAKGPRLYDWAATTRTSADTGCRWLVVRRHPRTRELAYFRCYAPHPVPLGELVRVAGRRWAVEESFQAGKGLAGLDEYQHRKWLPWRRWTLLAMLAYALLTAITAAERADHPHTSDLIALTCNEVCRLLTTLILRPARSVADPRAWSRWRRRHQHRARTSHHRRREATLT